MASFAITLLKEEFAAGDIESKIRACSKVVAMATVLGPDRTCNELLPTLTELVGNFREADEVLFVLSKHLSPVMDLVDGNFSSLCSLLELLSVVEETTVRERAVKNLIEICKRMTAQQAWQEMFPLMKRLAEAEWFTPRRSACGLLSAIYCQVDPSRRTELLDLLKILVADETPMVRRTVALAIGGMALADGGQKVALDVLLPIWISLSEDPHFSVRCASVSVTGNLVQAVGKESALKQILPHCTKLSLSRGWRVRNALAMQLGRISSGLKCSHASLLSMLSLLSRDYEDEVSENCINQVDLVGTNIFEEEGVAGVKLLLDAMLPVFKQVAVESPENRRESSFKLRKAVAMASLQLAKLSPKEVGAKLVGIWEAILSDQTSSNSAEVTRTLIQGLPIILSSLDSLSFTDKWGKRLLALYESSKSRAVDELNAKVALANSQGNNQQASGGEGLPGDPVETPRWRVRVNILQSMDQLVVADKQIAVNLWLSALSDEAFEVRVAAGEVLVKFSKTNPDLVEKDLCPLLLDFFKRAQTSKNYQHRIAVLRACGLLTSESALAKVESVFTEALKDPVSNVVVACLLVAISNKQVAKLANKDITPLLQSKSPDVEGFAKTALLGASG